MRTSRSDREPGPGGALLSLPGQGKPRGATKREQHDTPPRPSRPSAASTTRAAPTEPASTASVPHLVEGARGRRDAPPARGGVRERQDEPVLAPALGDVDAAATPASAPAGVSMAQSLPFSRRVLVARPDDAGRVEGRHGERGAARRDGPQAVRRSSRAGRSCVGGVRARRQRDRRSAPGTSSIVSMPPTHRLARSWAFDEAVRHAQALARARSPTTAMAARATMMQARFVHHRWRTQLCPARNCRCVRSSLAAFMVLALWDASVLLTARFGFCRLFWLAAAVCTAPSSKRQ